MAKKYVIINGRTYDNITGLPVDNSTIKEQLTHTTKKEETTQTAKSTKSRGVALSQTHKPLRQRTITLNRRHVKKPHVSRLSVENRSAKDRNLAIKKHQQIQKFAKTSPAEKPVAVKKSTSPDKPAQTHPVVHRSIAKVNINHAAKTQRTIRNKRQIAKMNNPLVAQKTAAIGMPKPAKILKNEAIEAALKKEIATQNPHRAKRTRSRFSYWLSTASAGLAVMILGGYLTYLSMPNISIRIAAIQSGVDAKYPGYKPSGYALSGPISVKSGEVTMKFAYSGGHQNYTITQQKSDWDSSAVKESISGDNEPTITSVNGLTIFTNDNKTTWVNGGVLYQIDSKAPLSNEQIARIATSL